MRLIASASAFTQLIRTHTENAEKVCFDGHWRFDAVNHICRSEGGCLIVMGYQSATGTVIGFSPLPSWWALLWPASAVA